MRSMESDGRGRIVQIAVPSAETTAPTVYGLTDDGIVLYSIFNKSTGVWSQWAELPQPQAPRPSMGTVQKQA